MAIDRDERARLSLGASSEVLYRRVNQILSDRVRIDRPLRILDVGCGSAGFMRHVADKTERYVGVDTIRHEGAPKNLEFFQSDLDKEKIPFENGTFDAVVSIETIEHLENPRALVREMSRVCRSGGLLIVTTPNQESLLSKMTFLMKNEFNAFQEPSYPAHITALLAIDLIRISKECELQEVQVDYTLQGRIPFSSVHFPSWLSRLYPRLFSDNVILSAIRQIDERPTRGNTEGAS